MAVAFRATRFIITLTDPKPVYKYNPPRLRPRRRRAAAGGRRHVTILTCESAVWFIRRHTLEARLGQPGRHTRESEHADTHLWS